MDNKCPKCGEKLSIFYLKTDCPKCGCDLINYNLDERLEEESIKAEAEWAKVDAAISKVKRFFRIKSKEEKTDEKI